MQTKIDNQISLETAEGIDIELTPAGLGVRSLAFVYDLMIRSVIFIVAATALGFAGKFGVGAILIILFFLEWFYPVVFEVTKGATPGKKAYGLTVVYDNGLPINFAGSMIRNLFRSIDILPSFYVLGGIWMLLSKKSKRIGDYLAGTMVVYKETPLDLGDMDVEKVQVVAMALNQDQQKAVIDFAERSQTLSQQRQQELANILSPLVGCEGEEAVVKLKSIAASLVGRA